MLKILIPKQTLWDEETEKFVRIKTDIVLILEHSLLSVSKWEQIWKKPFLASDSLTLEETISYVRCMTINTQNDDRIYYALTNKDIVKVNEYIADKATATFFSNTKDNKKHKKEKIITSELIYYWMIACNIPFSCEKWHLNRLLTLISVCNEENKAQENSVNHKTGAPLNAKQMADRAAMNRARRMAMNSRG